MAVAHFRSAYEQRERNPFGGRLAKLKHVATGSRQRRSQVNVEPCYTLVDLRFPRFCKERFTTSRGNTHIVETLATPEWEVNLQMSGVPLNLQRYLSWTCFRSPRHRPISQVDYGACNLLIVLAQAPPSSPAQPQSEHSPRARRSFAPGACDPS